MKHQFAIFAVLLLAMATPVLIVGQTGKVAPTIVDEWDSIKAPPPPALKPVIIRANETALLLLDFNKQTCSEKRLRCINSLPKLQKLLTEARSKGVPVVYSVPMGIGAGPGDIAKELAPVAGEPMVVSGMDKFVATNLEQILKEKNVKTVIIAGTSSHGAVLYTASGAVLRGMQVIVPVDGMSADNPYAEQYTAWHLANAPRLANAVTLTKIDLIRY